MTAAATLGAVSQERREAAGASGAETAKRTRKRTKTTMMVVVEVARCAYSYFFSLEIGKICALRLRRHGLEPYSTTAISHICAAHSNCACSLSLSFFYNAILYRNPLFFSKLAPLGDHLRRRIVIAPRGRSQEEAKMVTPPPEEAAAAGTLLRLQGAAGLGSGSTACETTA